MAAGSDLGWSIGFADAKSFSFVNGPKNCLSRSALVELLWLSVSLNSPLDGATVLDAPNKRPAGLLSLKDSALDVPALSVLPNKR